MRLVVFLSACLMAAPLMAAPLMAAPLMVEKSSKQEGTLAETVSQQQVLREYQDFLAVSQDASIDFKVAAMRRISSLQVSVNRHNSPNQDPLSNESAQAVLRKNIQLYQEILAKYPQRQGNDTVLYQLAEAYENTLDLDLSIKALDRLVETYPASSYAQEAVFRRAEMLFSQMEYEASAEAYRQVAAFGVDTPFYTFALYKHGWSLFRQERFEGSIDSFLNVLDSMVKGMKSHDDMLFFTQLNSTERELFIDTLRVISLSFSYLSDALSITSRLALHSERRNEYLIYGSLGDLYLKKERYYDAAQVLYEFTARHANHVQAPLFYIRAIAAAQQGGFASLVLERKQEFSKRYGYGSDYWLHHSLTDNPKVVAYLKDSMQQLAQHYHALAQHSKKSDDFQRAVKWYKQYIEAFKADPKTAEMNFTLAEALFENKRFDEAAAQYEKVAYDYAAYDKSAEAGYAALMAHQKQAGLAEDKPQGTAPNEAWLSSAQHFAQTYPDHLQTINVLLKVAEGYYALKNWEEVIVAEKSLLSRAQGINEQQRLTALIMLGHAQFESTLFQASSETYLQALILEEDDEKRRGLKENAASALYKQGEAARQEGDLAAAATYFQQVRIKVPGTKVQAVADYDAATALFELQEWFKSIMILQTFQQEFPSHRLQSNVPAMLAVAFESLNQPINAAEQFERVSQTSNNSDVKKEALWSAAVLYEENGNAVKAMPLYQTYLERFPNEFYDAMEIRHKLAKFYQEKGDTQRYLSWLNDIVQADRAAKEKRTERSSLIAAQASLVLANIAYPQFFTIHLVAPLKQNLQRKKEHLEASVQTYENILEYGIAQTSTVATHHIAEMYRNFAKELLGSERPEGLNADEQEEYTFLLEDQAMPFEDKAIEMHEINAHRLAEGLYDDSVKASLAALAELMPTRYAKNELREKQVQWVSKDDLNISSGIVGTPVSRDSYSAVFSRALKAMGQRGEQDQAINLFQTLVEKAPENIEAYLNLGILFYSENNVKEALNWFEKSLSLDEGNVIANNYLGILARQQGGFPQAEAYYLKAIRQDKTYQNAHLNLAILYDLYHLAPKKASVHYADYLKLDGTEDSPVKFWQQDLERRLEQKDNHV